jgi:hypothetical protein
MQEGTLEQDPAFDRPLKLESYTRVNAGLTLVQQVLPYVLNYLVVFFLFLVFPPKQYEAMGQFSQANAAATCSALSDKAHSMVVQAQRVLQAAREESGDHDLYQSQGMLSSRLQQLGHHANQLGYFISDATVVHSQLGNILQSGLAECQNALTMVSDGLETGGDGTYDRNAVASYLSFVGAFVSLFVLGDQLLIM